MIFFPTYLFMKLKYCGAGGRGRRGRRGGRGKLNVQAIVLVISRRFFFPFFPFGECGGKGAVEGWVQSMYIMGVLS